MASWSAEARVRAHAEVAGDAPAVLGAGTLTWAALDARCDDVAAAVRAAGVAPGGVVAVLAEPSADAIAAILGVLRAGAIAAPVPTGLATPEVAAALDVLDPVLVLADARSLPAVAATGRRPLAIDRIRVREAGARAASPAFDPEAPAVVVLTSGTTGRPKGVVLSGRAMAASAASWLAALPPATGWLLALGLGHVAGLGILWRAIDGRVPLRIVERGDPGALLAAIAAEPRMSHVSLVPAQLARLLDAAGGVPPPPSLRAVLLGGGPIPPALVTLAVRGGWPVVPTYGLSETASGATALATADALDHPGSAGGPLPGTAIGIDDPDADGVGEIVVVTAARCSGYLGDPGPVPAATAPVRTGDLGRLDGDGRLVVVDRRLDRIVRGGENVAPAEVESVLLAHPAVADAAVVGRPDPVWGHVPVAAIVLRPGAADPGDAGLAAHCRASLVGFRVPAAFVRLDALPRTAGGKLRRGPVRDLVAGAASGELARPGGDAIGWRVTGSGPLPLVLLHGTLSNAAQLERLAVALAAACDATVHAVDRRGSGTGRLAAPRPLDVGVHVDDLVAYLDARQVEAAVLVGASFGGVVALETAARRPERVLAVVAWEPPYGPLAEPGVQAEFSRVAAATVRAHRDRGAPGAAEAFLRGVAGDAAWDRLGARSRAFVEREGDGALADGTLAGLEPGGLARIAAPVTVLTGGASDPFYAPIADALAARIRGARRATLDGLAHPAPITRPTAVAAAVREALLAAGPAPGDHPATFPEPVA